MADEDIKKILLRKIKLLNDFIRDMEDYAKLCDISIKDEKLYIALSAQRKVLKELADLK